MSHSRWKLLPPPPPDILSQGGTTPPLLLHLLYNRGITNPSAIEPFLTADERLATPPFLLPDMSQAINRIYRALLSGEQIAVYGDFDADGVCATAILMQGLSSLGGRAIPYIPHRREEGYGLNSPALKNLRGKGVSLVITVDCGITNYQEVAEAQKQGMDIIITDHHSVPPTLPPAVAAVNPRRSPSDQSNLSGAGVAFKLLQALLQGRGQEESLNQLLDLVALGTVADIVPLIGENRYLVKKGLKLINESPRPGIQALIASAGLAPPCRVDAEHISWMLAPRLNAAGRMDHAFTSYRLLLASTLEAGRELAAVLEAKNAERQRLTDSALTKAREQALAQGENRLLLVYDTNYHGGVMGIVAGRLMEEFHRPAVVVQKGEEMSWGSARSLPEFDITAALWECSSFLSRFGGHPLAAGFSLPTRNLSALHQRLLEIASQKLADLDLRPLLTIDTLVPLSLWEKNNYSALQRLAPFGAGNPLPTFLSQGVEVLECRLMGGKSEHLRLKLKGDNTHWSAVGFGLGSLLPEAGSHLDIIYNLGVDYWGGQEVLRLNLLDFAPSGA